MSDVIRALVVDDEEIVGVSVKRILTRSGYEVDTVTTASEALAALDKTDYDLVITDLMMPEMNGIELMHTIRAQGREMSFLMITGYPTIRTAMQALRLGAIDYIPKPFTRQELLGPVNRALKRRESSEASLAAGTSPANEEAVNPGDRFVLPEHSWAVYQQDGTLSVGVEKSFLAAAGEIKTIEAPDANEMIEQGYPTIKLLTEDGGHHGVFAPFSGRVVAVNQEMLDQPANVVADQWLLKVIPSNLKAETLMLVKKN